MPEPGPIPLTDGEIDLERGVVRRAARVSELTGHEVAFLRYLWERRGRDVTRDQILTDFLGYSPTAVTRAVDVTISRLRRKLEVDPAQPTHLLTVFGQGYRFLPASQRKPARTNVPPSRDALVGREPLLEALLADLRDASEPLGLTGPAGVGKSRLAAEVARRAAQGPCPAGAFRIDLSRGEEGEPALARAAGLELRDADADAIARALASRGPSLVVLDEADSDPAGAERLLSALGTAGVSCVTTSRAPLSGTRSRPVPPLDDDDARALFEMRAEEAQAGWRRAEDDHAAIARIVADTDGLPLALELAANRVRAMSTVAIAAALDRSLALLRGRGTGRHASMEGAFAWSWDSLDDAGRAALTELSVFRGGASRDAAEHVLSGPDPSTRLDELVERGLARLADDRITPFHVVRELALAHGDSDRVREARERHAAWFVQRVHRLDAMLRTPESPAVKTEFLREQGNLRVALEVATGDDRAWLTFGLAFPVEVQCSPDLLALVEREAASSEPTVAVGRLMGLLAWAITRLARWDRAAVVGERFAALAATVGDRRNRVDASRVRSMCRAFEGDLDGSLAHARRGVELAGEDRSSRTRALIVLGAVQTLRRELDAACQTLAEAAEIAEADGDVAIAEAPLANLGSALALQGDRAGALAAWDRALRHTERPGGYGKSNLLYNRGWAYLIWEDWELALHDLEHSADLAREAGLHWTNASAGTAAAVALARLGRLEEAIDKSAHAVRSLREIGAERVAVPGSVYAALLSLDGRLEAARSELAAVGAELPEALAIDAELTDHLIRVWTGTEAPGDLAERLEEGTPSEGCTLHAVLLRGRPPAA